MINMLDVKALSEQINQYGRNKKFYFVLHCFQSDFRSLQQLLSTLKKSSATTKHRRYIILHITQTFENQKTNAQRLTDFFTFSDLGWKIVL